MPEKQTHPLDVHSSPSRPNVRSASIRKLGRDGTSFTPTERLAKDRLMRQFMRTGRKGAQVSCAPSKAFLENYELIDWGSG